jgi:hypothetical protein
MKLTYSHLATNVAHFALTIHHMTKALLYDSCSGSILSLSVLLMIHFPTPQK